MVRKESSFDEMVVSSDRPECCNFKLYTKDVEKYPVLTKRQEIELAKRIQSGDHEARELFINSNLRLVMKVAQKYMNLGLSYNDIIQEGNTGLIYSVDRYDYTKGAFSTFATTWIKKYIIDAINQKSRTIRIPDNVVNKISKQKKVTARLQSELDRDPTSMEVANELGCSVNEVEERNRFSESIESLDKSISGDEKFSIGDTIEDKRHELDRKFFNEALKHIVGKLLQTLLPTERQVVSSIFGLEDGIEKDLDEICEEHSLSIKDARKAYYSGIAKLRTPSRAETIREFYE